MQSIKAGFQEKVRARIEQVGVFRFTAEHALAFAAAFFIPTLIVYTGIYLFTML